MIALLHRHGIAIISDMTIERHRKKANLGDSITVCRADPAGSQFHTGSLRSEPTSECDQLLQGLILDECSYTRLHDSPHHAYGRRDGGRARVEDIDAIKCFQYEMTCAGIREVEGILLPTAG